LLYKNLKRFSINTEGSEVVSINNQLKLIAPDGEKQYTDAVDTEQLFRIIQSIPSKKVKINKKSLDVYY